MLKKVLTYGIGEMAVKGISFLALPFYTHMILPEEYGVLGLLAAIVSFLPMIFTMQYIYAYVRFSVHTDVKKLVSTYFFMGIGLNIFYIVFAILLYFGLFKNYGIHFQYYILAIMAPAIIFLFQIFQMHHRSTGNSKEYLKFSLGYALSALFFNIVCLVYFQDNVLAMLLSNLLVASVASLIAGRYLRNNISYSAYDFMLMMSILKYSVPLIPSAIGLLLFSQSDKLILAQSVDKQLLGIYTMATTLGLVMGYLSRALFMAYQPIFYQKVQIEAYDEIERQFIRNILLLLSGLIISLGVIYIAYRFIDTKYISGMYIAFVMASSATFMAFAQMMELHISYMKKNIYISYIYGVNGLFALIGLWIFVPVYGIVAAPIVLLICKVSVSVMMYIIGQKVLYIPYAKWHLLLFYISLLSISIILILLMKSLL